MFNQLSLESDSDNNHGRNSTSNEHSSNSTASTVLISSSPSSSDQDHLELCPLSEELLYFRSLASEYKEVIENRNKKIQEYTIRNNELTNENLDLRTDCIKLTTDMENLDKRYKKLERKDYTQTRIIASGIFILISLCVFFLLDISLSSYKL